MSYDQLLEDEIFMKGDLRGRLGTTLTILTDLLVDLNSLELYYQKPSSKSISPAEIESIRKKIDKAKVLIQEAMKAEAT